jgi:uncharacterized membrane protein YhaH (DUF805 family)
MDVSRKKLGVKGWSNKEINDTIKILQAGKKKRKLSNLFFDSFVYWTGLLIMILGNFAFSIIITFLLISSQKGIIYVLSFFLAACFSIVIASLVKDLDHLDKKHHVSYLLIIPIVGLITFFLTSKFADSQLSALQVTHNNPWIAGIIYFAGFIIPYSYLVFNQKWKN